MSRPVKSKDKHLNKGFNMRLHPLLRQQLDKAVEMNASSVTEEVRIAIRERLDRLKLWPLHQPQ